MKGIILAGGKATRLYPLTLTISKQLLPVYDKPLIYYPLALLMNAGISDILIITTPGDQSKYKELLSDGHNYGINISYAVQKNPDGIAQAFILGEEFIKDDNVCLVLGDNIYYSKNLNKLLVEAEQNLDNGYSTIFGYFVDDPNRFGVIEFDDNENVIGIEEKPINPKSNYAVTGLYFYDNSVITKAKSLKPSSRNELEITDINNLYLKDHKLKTILMGKEALWLDAGTSDSLLYASNIIKKIEDDGQMVACLEEIAYKNGWIDKYSINDFYNNSYGNYVKKLILKR